MNSIIENCHIWHDTSPRGGAMNMAIDQLLRGPFRLTNTQILQLE